ncbi:hypothetical protein [Pseudoxanthomonas sp. PXM02]|uniref:hypothetical protein n=1 Tax=Pseudoxanthomonas sp. PXM02 TaxID=2769294 RepID=UPI00177D9AD5|nr:hypothetical protein [Pseudoxanthomonas sp. PXM02]MBD9479414.1 hypothetical protein [Pseudoxanthomonas sp. PXM02]
MRALILGVVLATLAHSAVAGEAVQLEGRKLAGQTATGTCGGASIKVSGIEGEWISPGGTVEVKGRTGLLHVGSESYMFMEDRNVVACVASKAGPKIVLLAFCDARQCPPSNYYIIDPINVRIETTTEYGECPLSCAEKALGARLPDLLRDGMSSSE